MGKALQKTFNMIASLQAEVQTTGLLHTRRPHSSHHNVC